MSFVKTVSSIYLRPFPSLGTMVATLASDVFTDNGFDYEMNAIEKTCHNFLAAIFKEFYRDETLDVSLHDVYAWGSYETTLFTKPKYALTYSDCTWDMYYKIYMDYIDYNDDTGVLFPCLNSTHPCCNIFTSKIIGNHLQRFMLLMKHSDVSNYLYDKEDSKFVSNFVENSPLFKSQKVHLGPIQ